MTVPNCDSDSASPWRETIAGAIATGAICEQCPQQFKPDRGKRFCSSKCRAAFHNAKRVSETPAKTPERFIERPSRISETPETFRPVPAAPKPNDDEFDWDDPEVVVAREQNALAVFRNRNGDVTIRERGHWPNEDTYIVITQANLGHVIAALSALERREDGYDG
jgi:hypothetical protein